MAWENDVDFYTKTVKMDKRAKENLISNRARENSNSFSELVVSVLIKSNENDIEHAKKMKEMIRKRYSPSSIAQKTFDDIEKEHGL